MWWNGLRRMWMVWISMYVSDDTVAHVFVPMLSMRVSMYTCALVHMCACMYAHMCTQVSVPSRLRVLMRAYACAFVRCARCSWTVAAIAAAIAIRLLLAVRLPMCLTLCGALVDGTGKNKVCVVGFVFAFVGA